MNKSLKLLGLVIASCVLAMVFGGQKASAAGEATTQLPADNTFMVVSSQPAIPGNFHNPVSTNYMYIPQNSTYAEVQINNISNGPISLMYIGWLDNGGTCHYSVDQRVNPGNGSTVAINATSWPSRTVADTTGTPLKIFCIQVTSTSMSIVNYKLYASGGLLGVYAGPNNSLGSSYYANNGSKWSETISFAPPCNGTTGANGNNILLYDLDNGYSQNPNVQVHLVRYDRRTGAYISAVPLGGDVDYSHSGYGVDVYNTRGGHYAPWNNNYTWQVYPRDNMWYADSRYELVVGTSNTVGQANKIRIRIPFDQIYSTFTCEQVDVCANITGVQTAVPAGYFQSGGNCYQTNHRPTLSGTGDCSTNQVRVTSTDANPGAYVIRYAINTAAGASSTSVSRSGDGYFYINMGSNGRHTAVTVYLYTAGVDPSPHPSPATSTNTANLTFGPCYAWVTGQVHNAYNTAQRYAGVVIETCIAGVSATTDANGNYSFEVLRGNGYCVRVSGNPAGSAATNVRPNGAGYTTCGAYGGTIASPDYCAAFATYECQIAAGNGWPGCGTGNNDRSIDTGFNFALRFRPTITCSITGSIGLIETTQPFNVTVDVTNTGPSWRPSVAGTVTLAVTGQPNRNAAYGPLATGTNTNPDISFTNNVINTSGTYTITASATGTGDGLSISPTPFVCTNSAPIKVGEHPYMKEFGGDVWSGGNFSNISSCTPPTGSGGNVFGFNRLDTVNNRYVGGSAQLTITALLNVNQYGSASNRDPASGTNTYGPKGLTFANIGTGQPSTPYGGGYGSGSARCITNFFDDTKVNSTNPDIALNTNPTAFPPAPVTPPTPVITNITSSATLSTRPGDDTTVDMRLANIRDGISNRWGFNEWASTGGQVGTWVRMSWTNYQEFSSIRLWDRPNPIDQILSGTITFADVAAGSSCPARNFGPLSNGIGDYDPNHVPGVVTPATNCRARAILVTITSIGAGTLNAGFAEIEVNAITSTTPGGGDFPSGRVQYHLPANTDKTMSSPLTIPLGSQVAVYVDGDVYIGANITFATGYSTLAQIPYFALIVKGNIYVSSAVTRLDGLYVAQPDGTANSGTIYTCATALNTPCTTANVHTEGQNRLAVNGSLVANRIKYLRSSGSLRLATFQEVPDFATGLGGSTRAAEVINYTAQMYLAPSPLRKPIDPPGGHTGSGTSKPYDAIRSLPPIF